MFKLLLSKSQLLNTKITFGIDSNNSPIEWIVLDVQDSKILLISAKILETIQYHNLKVNATWESSSIRKYLNTIFFEKTFDENEKQKILETEIETFEKPRKDNISFKTLDKIFLLDEVEIRDYFTANKKIKSKNKDEKPTLVPYIKKSILGTPIKSLLLDKNFSGRVKKTKIKKANSNETTNKIQYFCSYWLRSSGFSKATASHVDCFGSIDAGGKNITCYSGIRPAIWVKRDNFTIK